MELFFLLLFVNMGMMVFYEFYKIIMLKLNLDIRIKLVFYVLFVNRIYEKSVFLFLLNMFLMLIFVIRMELFLYMLLVKMDIKV